MDKSKSRDTIPQKAYGFVKNNKPDGKYIAIEVWEKGHPDKGEIKIIGVGTKGFGIDETKLDSFISYWKGVARGAKFENPMFTLQGDIGKGSEISYAYKNGREESPLNASSYTIKPLSEEGVVIIRLPGDEGKSLVYHSPLNSPTLKEEVGNFNKILVRFFKGELIEPTNKSPGWEFRNEVVVDKETLRKEDEKIEEAAIRAKKKADEPESKIKFVDPKTITVKFGGKHPPKDEMFIALFKKVIKGEIPYYWALVKKEAIKPFSDHKPQISEELRKSYLEEIHKDKFPSVHIYEEDGKYVMSDDYGLYYLYLELGWSEIPSRIMGEPLPEATRHLTKLTPPRGN